MAEAYDFIKAKSEEKAEDTKNNIKILFLMAQSLAENIWANKDQHPRELWELFPGMFENEREQAEKEKNEAEIQAAKNNRKMRAEQMRIRRLEREFEKEGGE